MKDCIEFGEDEVIYKVSGAPDVRERCTDFSVYQKVAFNNVIRARKCLEDALSVGADLFGMGWWQGSSMGAVTSEHKNREVKLLDVPDSPEARQAMVDVKARMMLCVTDEEYDMGPWLEVKP